MKKILSFIVDMFAFLLLIYSTTLFAAEHNPTTIRQSAIAIPDQYAAQVAEDIMRKGGNAVDAAVATGFTLAVTYFEAGNIGGGGFMLIHMKGESTFLDYRETAPLAADRDMYLDKAGNVIENASVFGSRAIGVPGTVAGLWAAHQRFGKLPWKDLISPAIQIAKNGFLPHKTLLDDIAENLPHYRNTTNFEKFFGTAQADQLFKQPELAETLQRIADKGPQEFYHGKTAHLIAEQMQRSGGMVSLKDLADYKVVWREPLKANWRGYQILSAPPPSSGGFGVIQLLKMKDFLAEQFKGLKHNSPQYVHLVAEMEKRVFADRAEYLGDPAFVKMDMQKLISDDYTKRRAMEVDPKNISKLESVKPGLESPDTTHYSIIDGDGNAVSNTYTLNWSFGSGVVVEGGGFLLNNEMDDFSVKPGVPNIFGVVGNTANEIQPGKRMLSSMSPTILLKDDRPAMVVGTPGGSTIFTSVFQTIVNIIDFNMTPYEAVNAGRFHHQLLPPDLITQSPSRPLSAETTKALIARGYRVEDHSWEFGDVQVIWVKDGQMFPASDPRRRGVSKVFNCN